MSRHTRDPKYHGRDSEQKRPRSDRSHRDRSLEGRHIGDRRGETTATQKIDPFELFCAYHLGIGPDKSYRPANVHDVARRFGVEAGVIRQSLENYGMDPETMMNTDFDLAMAQVDIQVAPEGIDRVELAKGLYKTFRTAPSKKRDWQKLLAEDARENEKIFGRKSR